MQDLKAKENFLYVDAKKLIKSIHMPKLWANDPSLLLLPEERLFGTRDSLEDYIKMNDLKVDINDNINGNNFESSEVFDELLLNYQTWMTETLIININSPGNTFETMLNSSDTIKNKKVKEDVQDIPIPPVVETQQPIFMSTLESDVPIRTVKKAEKRPKRAIDLDTKLKDLEAGKVINISAINNYGVGTRVGLFKNPKNMFVTRDERIMTDKYEALEMFVNLLKRKKNKKRYTEELANARKYFGMKKKEEKEEKKEKVKSTKKSVKKSKKYVSESSEETESEESESDTEESEEVSKKKWKTPTSKKSTPKKSKKSKKQSSSEEESEESEEEPVKKSKKAKKSTPKKSKKSKKQSSSSDNEEETE